MSRYSASTITLGDPQKTAVGTSWDVCAGNICIGTIERSYSLRRGHDLYLAVSTSGVDHGTYSRLATAVAALSEPWLNELDEELTQ